ncbi:MAG: FG-GAP repeat domain-containing protein, partial [Acidimicrobiia bacterium]
MRRDIIFRYSGLLVLILLAMLLGASHVAAQIPVGERPRSIAGGDFNEDGIPDLAVGNSKSSDVSILIGNGDGSFQPAVNFRTGELDNFPLGGNGTRSRGIAVGDYNEDGHQDLAFADAGDERDAVYFVSILLGNGDGTFGPSTDFGGFGG